MKAQNPIPPQFPQRILLLFLRDDLAEEVLGDLEEKFYFLLKTKSLFNARLNYWYQVIHYIRPFAIRKSRPVYLNRYAMYQSYFKIGWRNLLKNKGYSFINISGLSIGIASSLLIFLIVRQEYSFDKFHAKADRIYRVETTKVEIGSTFAGTPTGVLASLRNDFQGIEKVGAVVQVQGKVVGIEQGTAVDKYKESVAFIENELFHILDFQWLKGNPETELNAPNTIILSESYAQKFFGVSDKALGKYIHFDEEDWMVTGIVADPPDNTDFPFHIMASYANIRNTDTQYDQKHWGWGDNHQTFILVKERVSAQEIEQQFPKMIEKYMGKEALKKRAYSLLPLDEIHFEYNYGGRSANPKMLKTLVVVGLFLLLIACANFINLATAQGIRRSREVGVRKVFGSNRSQLIHQFLSEAGFITLLALMLSLIEACLVLPFLSQLLGITISTNSIWSIPSIVFLMTVFQLTALLAGFYPALIVSAMNPIGAIKEARTGRVANGLSVRNSLVVFQFCISLVLIIGTLIIGQQLQLFKNANLGFDYDSVITADLPNGEPSKLEVMRRELLASPFIQNVSFSNNSPSSENNWMGITQYNRAGEAIEINTQMKMVDSYYIDTYNIHLLAGEQFQQGDTLPKGIINEVMASEMGFIDPKDAVGQMISSGQASFAVIGVVKNFHVNSLHQKIDP
ncbi:MAG TPA: ABC transporter permease, partial [Chryseolinea sp.]|nr:ABC transporter permease [Chryseolinea sp.]